MDNKYKEWIEVTVVTTSEAVEAISGILYNTNVKGVSIEDPEDLKYKKVHPGKFCDYFDEKLLQGKDVAIIKGYYKEDENLKEYIKYIKDSIEHLEEFGINKGKGTVNCEKVNEQDWENNWKKYYKPTKIGNSIVVRPSWEKYEPKQGEIIIDLDPGMAFGTGTHETTRMCIKALEKYVNKDSTVFDIGTGSGILSIAAAKLYAKKVIGVDLDPVAVKSAKENVRLNDVNNIEILHGNLMDVVEGKADVIVANILADIIIFLTDDVKKSIKKGGYFISSGIIKDRKEEVLEKLKECNFEIKEINMEGEWVCIVAKLN